MPSGAPPGVRYGGRQKGTPNRRTLQQSELARIAGPEALAVLRDIMNDKKVDVGVRRAAASDIADRVYGRPSQHVHGRIGVAHFDFSSFSDDQLEDVLNHLGPLLLASPSRTDGPGEGGAGEARQ